MKHIKKQMLRKLAAQSFWRSRNAKDDWSTGYWLGLYRGYKYAATLAYDPWPAVLELERNS